jgi:hypothetical protein
MRDFAFPSARDPRDPRRRISACLAVRLRGPPSPRRAGGFLDRWLANPEKLIPRQKMGFSVGDSAVRADIIQYLRTATDGGRPQRPL